ncbi:aminoglycoside phosphotransferase [Kribbella flavida DSM 17836]|uniref:Aminoglycoside phosphotransferase n=1 Tax=Kribbella flavida (strain DSM 17836 / JCM 10339 / NBRC 14399) TaxID=479435 RepID=D2PP11_KRIFD|nr:phosphotransferase [Kribbella flavida]ADB32829.1 aminoglycoside phosphotransferase [Kribbella flavida DSM 17836]
MSGPPVVDYSATSARPAWSALPEALRRSLAVALGTEIVEAGPSVGAGFTGGLAAPLRLADGRKVFAKAAPDTQHGYDAYRREAEIVPQLPPAVRVPAVVATAQAGGSAGERWFAVASEYVAGRMPGTPWTAADFAAATAACEVMAEALSPTPLAGLATFVAELEAGGFPFHLADEILAGDRPLPPGFQPWLPTALPELSALIARYPVALAGDSAMHSDLRPDNLLIDRTGQCWTVDWNWLSLGPAWCDWVGLLPVAQAHGIDTAAAIRRSPLTADVPADDLDCCAAIIAAYMLDALDAPPPPGCTPELRRHQRLYAWTFLDWLALRRGWDV